MKNDSSKADLDLSMAQGLTYRLGGRHGYVPAHTHTSYTAAYFHICPTKQAATVTAPNFVYLDKLFLHWLVALG